MYKYIKITHLCFILNHTVLFLPDSDLGNLIFSESTLLFQFWAPESLDRVHGGTKLALLDFNFSPKQLILTQNLGKYMNTLTKRAYGSSPQYLHIINWLQYLFQLGLQVKYGVVSGLPQRVGYSGGHVVVPKG